MSKQNKNNAIEKLNLEISKEIDNLINVAKSTGTGELLYYISVIHFSRLLRNKNVSESEKEALQTSINQAEEAFKYNVQLLLKHGQNHFIEDKNTGLVINVNAVQFLTKVFLNINAKHETLSIVTLFDDKDVIVSGERNQFLKLDFGVIMDNEKTSKFFMYFIRLHMRNDLQKNNTKDKDTFIEYFYNEYLPYSDLFQLEFGITLDEFIILINFILDTVTNQITANKENFTYHQNGNVDIQDHNTIINYGLSLFLDKNLLTVNFGNKFNNIIERLTFNSAEFDEKQLKYNLIARKPIFDFNDKLLLSPENLLDSLLVNSHYSLLEAGTTKNEYIKRYSDLFLDKITQIALEYGYEEVNREFDLYEGRNQIGDIDLILKNSAGHYLLIEAKNHTLPLDVYFGDYEATDIRLNYLLGEWEYKVKRRYENIEKNYEKYGLTANFNYLIVTKFPEILSHFSTFNVLEINEFKYWLSQKNEGLKFDELANAIYEYGKTNLTTDDLNKMMTDLNTGWQFKSE